MAPMSELIATPQKGKKSQGSDTQRLTGTASEQRVLLCKRYIPREYIL